MFDIGFWEMVLVGVVALVVFGPERLPRVARETALWVRKARSMVASVKQDIDHELQLHELQESLRREQKALSALRGKAEAQVMGDHPVEQHEPPVAEPHGKTSDQTGE